MPDLAAIYNSFDGEVPLPAEDDARYVDLSQVRGQRVAEKLARQIINARKPSHHLLMGHTKCGKTTELNRTAHMLRKEGYLTVFFDIAKVATPTFEYTMLLLVMAQQVIEQVAKENIEIHVDHVKKLAEFLQEKEMTVGGTKSLEGKVSAEAEAGAGLLGSILGKLGIGLELGGSFQRSREITTKIEADTRGFISAIKELIKDACDKMLERTIYKGLVIICDGCDKLAIAATDGNGKSHDLQQSLFVDHASDLRAVPCHVIYTVPLSIAVNLGDIWEQSPVFVPAVPVSQLPGIKDDYPKDGRVALHKVVQCRLHEEGTKVEELFAEPDLISRLIDASGGHISDLLLLVRQAVLEAQIDEAGQVAELHVNRSIRSRALEYTRLIESSYLDTLWNIDHFKTAQSNNDFYRAVIFKRLALEYICGNDNRFDLHPLVAASEAYRRYKEVKVNESNK